MNPYWNFPAATGGLINSINNAGLETFRGNALESLTREICQNSIDAVKNPSEPVIVEFKSFSIDTDGFPNRHQFLEALEKCKKTWRGRNPKTEDFIENALAILKKDKMNFLRISDFNTKGLEGADTAEIGTPWSSLVREAGSSNKGESSGGSFGIGKSAPFLNSNLRTLFYSSLDISGYESYIGVANIMSFKINEDEITVGNGYFTDNDKSTAINEQLHLDPTFTRNETGTDIYVSAFEPVVYDWEVEIKKSVLFNFFITIYQQKLIVKINNFEINHENIASLIAELEDNEENTILKKYFEALTSNKTIKIAYPAKQYKGIEFGEGEATLYLINGEDLNRRVLMTRKTGMRIFEQKNISGTISFTGILMITGNNMNYIFKEMENPAHNEWSHERYEKNPNLAKKVYADLRKFIREAVKKEFQEKITDKMDAVGVSDFLPNKSLINGTDTKKTESLTSTIKEIVSKEKKQEKVKIHKPTGEEPEEIEKQLAGEYGIVQDGEYGGNGFGTHANGGTDGAGTTEPGGINQLDKNKDGEISHQKDRKPSKKPIEINQRYICTNKTDGKYRFFISPKKSLSNVRLVFSVLGEQNNFALPIKSATVIDSDISIEEISGNTVYLTSTKNKKIFTLDIEVNYPTYCVMEVVLYEN